MKDTVLAPGIHGPSLRWYKPSGFLALLLRTLWRFFVTGKPVRGKGDNATFLHDATVDYRGGPVEKLTRARWRRLAWRWAVVGVPWVILDLRIVFGSPWGWVLLGYVTVTAGGGGYLAVMAFRAWWPHREVRREFVYPTWQVVCRVIGERYNRRSAARSITYLPQEELCVRIHLPAVPLDDGLKKRIATSAGERLGMLDPSASWVVKGARAYVDLSPRRFPPRTLVYAEVQKLVEAADSDRPFVGLAAGRTPVYADFANDGPHAGVSGGTGTGKSTLMRLIMARRVAAGHGVVCCDYKVTSHKWLRRIAQEDPRRAIYLTDEEEISEGILAVFAEFTRRREILKTDPGALEFFRPIDLVVEELNSLASLLRKWWGHERRAMLKETPDEYVPVVPPAVDAMAALVQMGRELSIFVHFLAQRLDASALAPKDGGAIRESITNRFLANYTKAAWNMLCGGVPFEAFPGGPRGIWTAVVHNTVTHFRVPATTDLEAYDLAMSGPEPAGPVLGGARLVQPHERQLLTLGEAWELVGADSLDALRKAVQRAKLPSYGKRGNALMYDVKALQGLGQRAL